MGPASWRSTICSLGQLRVRRLNENRREKARGVSVVRPPNYECGEREMPVALFKSLFESFGVDPLWILFGPGADPLKAAGRRIDTVLLQQVIQAIEDGLASTRKRLRTDKKAQLVRLAYDHCAEHGRMNGAHVKEMLQLAA